ncbi:MAG: tetratricopeptide repeat protein [Cyanobacteria bacterium J06621_8]
MEDFLQRGIAQAEQNNYELAIDFFNQAIASDLEFPKPYYYRGLAYFELGEAQKAIVDYDHSLSLDSRQKDVYLSRAQAFLALNQLQAVIIDLQAVLSFDANCDRAYKLSSNICLRLREYDQAIEYLKQAGEVYLKRHDRESCSYCVARIRQIEHQRVSAKGGLTNELFLKQVRYKISKGLFGEAYVDCNWLLQLDPYDARAHYLRGEVCWEIEEYEHARLNFRQAVKWYRTQGNISEAERLERRCTVMQLDSVYKRTKYRSRGLVRVPEPETKEQHRLNELVGNWDIAQGLVATLMKLHPDQPEYWYWTRAIHDLEHE